MSTTIARHEIPGYKIVKKIGKGGMAVVYLAIQEALEREVALKILLPSLLSDPSFGERFVRETRIIAKLPHPNIVPVYDAGNYQHYYYLAMEWLGGDNLTTKIQRGLTLANALHITRDIAAALDYAHQQGFIHRDVKPDNVLFKPNSEQAILSDFGIARPITSSGDMTVAQTIIGSPKYMSPEQALGEPLDQQSDIFSLGIVFHKMLTGQEPYQGSSTGEICVKHQTQDLPPLPEKFAMLKPIVTRMLAIDKTARYQQASDLLQDLDATIAKLGDKGNLTCTQPKVTQVIAQPHSPSDSQPKAGPQPESLLDEKAQHAKTIIHQSPQHSSTNSAKRRSAMPLLIVSCITAILAVGGYIIFMQSIPSTNKHATAHTAIASSNQASATANITTNATTSTTTNNTTATPTTSYNSTASTATIIAQLTPNKASTTADDNIPKYPIKLQVTPSYATIVDKTKSKTIHQHETMAAGEYLLTIQSPGYQTETIKLNHPGDSQSVNLAMIKYPDAREFSHYQRMMQGDSFEQAINFLKTFPQSPFTYIAETIAQPVPDLSDLTILAEQGDPIAQFSLGELYDSDIPNLKNNQKALSWSEKASQQNYPMAWVQYALFLLDNQPNAEDKNTALSLLDRAAQEGFYLAQTKLGELYFFGQLVEEDKARAFELFQQAATQGDSAANASLSHIYQHGYGVVAPDKEKSVYYSRLADNLTPY